MTSEKGLVHFSDARNLCLDFPRFYATAADMVIHGGVVFLCACSTYLLIIDLSESTQRFSLYSSRCCIKQNGA